MFVPFGRNRSTGKSSRRVTGWKPYLEPLEDRIVPAVVEIEAPPTDAGPNSVAVGDFNGDGANDLAVGTSDGQTVDIYLNYGQGFLPVVSSSIGLAPSSPTGMAVADVNRDGKLDLLVTTSNGGVGSVAFLRGDGHGSFTHAGDFSLSKVPQGLAVADLNRDGWPDIVTANALFGIASVSVLLNARTTTGSFAGHVDTPVPGAKSVAVGDVNGDGAPDVAVAGGASDFVSVLLNNGSGVLGAPHNQMASGTVSGVAVADFNGDGKLDLAASYSSSDLAGIYLGHGDGTFDPAVTYGTGMGPAGVAVGDLNGDGFPDLVTPNPGGPSITLLFSNGDGTFFIGGGGAHVSPQAAAVADFNGDNSPDLAVANSGDNTVSILASLDPAPATHFLLQAPTVVDGGSPFAVTVVAQDATGAPAVNWRGTVHFSSSDPMAGLPADYAFTPADHGTHTFNVTLASPGAQTLSITDPFRPGFAASAAINVPVSTSEVKVVPGKARFNRATGRFLQQVTLQNVSGHVLHGPLWLVLDGLDARVKVRRLAGRTVNHGTRGSPYIAVPLPANGLAPGGRVSVLLQLAARRGRKVRFHLLVLTGTGIP
jgi:hypothetical protein